jgi:hypothetical protein
MREKEFTVEKTRLKMETSTDFPDGRYKAWNHNLNDELGTQLV